MMTNHFVDIDFHSYNLKWIKGILDSLIVYSALLQLNHMHVLWSKEKNVKFYK